MSYARARACVCVCVCVCEIEAKNNNNIKIIKKKTKQITGSSERPLLSPSQERDHEVSGLYDIAVKWLRTRVGKSCIDTSRPEIRNGHRRTQNRQLKQFDNMHRFVCRRDFGSCFLFSLSAYRRIIVVVVRVQIYIPNLPQII